MAMLWQHYTSPHWGGLFAILLAISRGYGDLRRRPGRLPHKGLCRDAAWVKLCSCQLGAAQMGARE